MTRWCTGRQAEVALAALSARMDEVGLRLHLTKIVYVGNGTGAWTTRTRRYLPWVHVSGQESPDRGQDQYVRCVSARGQPDRTRPVDQPDRQRSGWMTYYDRFYRTELPYLITYTSKT